MPFMKVNLNESDIKLIRRIARHEKRGEASVLQSLVKMSLGTVRIEERTGLYYGPVPGDLRAPLPKPRPRFASKEDRDAWVMTGKMPGDDGGIHA